MRILARLLELILTPIGYVFVFILSRIDISARWLDKRFNTKLRKPKITIEDVKQLIDTNLPLGSTSEEVFAFLKTHNIVHAEKVLDYEPRYEDALRLMQELPQQPDIVKKKIVAWVRNVGREWLVRWDIRIIFYLDEQNKLVEYGVKTIGMGL